jgi:G:T-mismatch repair DNA endonuclease (very short patch repair protein)
VNNNNVKRDAPDLVLEEVSEIIAMAGPKWAGKTCYMYQLIQDELEFASFLKPLE